MFHNVVADVKELYPTCADTVTEPLECAFGETFHL